MISETPPEETWIIRWTRLAKTNLAKSCLICDQTNPEMHHVKSINDLKTKYKKGEIDFWTFNMRAINRKQIPLCSDHHHRLHSGKLTPKERKQLQTGIKNFVKKKKNKEEKIPDLQRGGKNSPSSQPNKTT